MAEIELTVQIEHETSVEAMRPWLDQFEAAHRVRVRLTAFEWEDAWQRLVDIGLHQRGPDVSSVGSTWVAALAGMNALRSFSIREVKELGGEQVFMPNIWKSGLVATGDGQVASIPWSGYTRLIYYRRDWLQQVGVNETGAFQTPEKLVQTLKALQEGAFPSVWYTPAVGDTDTQHNIASWIWQAGGDFLSEDGKRVLLDQPVALAGMRKYFELFPYLTREKDLSGDELSIFRRGKVAACIGGPSIWLYEIPSSEDTAPEVHQHTGVALPLGAPFIGASNLVIWKHTRQPELALELVRFLTSPAVQRIYVPKSGLLPVRQDVLNAPPFSTDPIHQVMKQALHSGRYFPNTSKWGVIEDRLITAFGNVWNDILACEDVDVRAILHTHIVPLAKRLNVILS